MKVRHLVPIYSQHLHIKDPKWRKKSCGIVSLAMLLEYSGRKTKPDDLLRLGLKIDAYLPGIGWKHHGLVELAEKYGAKGENFDWAKLDLSIAVRQLKIHLKKYPVLTSIYNSFNPKRGGHLIVLVGMEKNKIFYHDPNAKKKSRRAVSLKKFLTGWKKRIIVINQ